MTPAVGTSGGATFARARRVADAPSALRFIRSGQSVGKVVLIVDDDDDGGNGRGTVSALSVAQRAQKS